FPKMQACKILHLLSCLLQMKKLGKTSSMNSYWILNILPECKINSLFNHCKDVPQVFSFFDLLAK
ncbi:MAG: hypothetical protein ACK55Z_08640, partial [bacterium]